MDAGFAQQMKEYGETHPLPTTTVPLGGQVIRTPFAQPSGSFDYETQTELGVIGSPTV